MKNKNKNLMQFEALAQREKKYARTKTRLLKALLDRLNEDALSDILIKDLAADVEVSEPTFYNYFDSKLHMLVYFIQMWSIEMEALSRTHNSESALQNIRNIFKTTCREISQHPQIMLEIIAFQAQGLTLSPHTIGSGEKWFFYPDIEGIETMEGMGLESILPPLIATAVSTGELPKEVDQRHLFLTLSSLFFGSALLILGQSPESLSSLLDRQIEQLFGSYHA